MNGRIPVLDYYIDDSFNFIRRKVFKLKAYEDAFKRLEEGTFRYYGKTLDYLLEAIGKYPVKGKTVCVFGAISVNCDAISIYNGAERVVVLEYNPIRSQHPKVDCMSYKDYQEKGIKCDVGISVSSFEHDGLSRYGDPLDPEGDFKAMKLAKNLIKKDGLLYLAVPVGPDALCWTAHRIYGRIRLPMLLDGWRQLDSFGFSEDMMDGVPSKDYAPQPVFVLQNV